MTDSAVVEAPESEVARDIARRGLMVAPLFLLVSSLFWGWSGLASSGYALALVLINFLAAAAFMSWAVRISPAFLMGGVLGGYILRLGVITLATLAVRNLGWFEVVPFAATLLITHLGLLFWETRHVSASLAYPGLKPAAQE